MASVRKENTNTEVGRLNKNLNLKILVNTELNEKVQNDLSEQIKKLEQKMSEIKLSILIPPIGQEVMGNFGKLSETLQNSTQSFTKALQMSLPISSISLPLLSIGISNALQSINWNGLREDLKSRIENYELLMQKYDLELWAIDRDLFDTFEFDDIELLSFEVIEH